MGAEHVNDKDRPMPPLIAFAGALGGLAVVRWAYKTAVRINRELEEARMARVAEAAHTGDIPTLRRDPVTGAYRPGLGPRPLRDKPGLVQLHRPDAMRAPRHRLDSPRRRRYGPALLKPPRETDSADGRLACPYAPGTLVPGLHPCSAAVLG